MSRKNIFVVLALWWWSTCVSGSFAQPPPQIDDQDQQAQETLRGLPGVAIEIEDLKPEAERDGLTKAQLRGDVERTLRQGGIRILSEAEQRDTPGQPVLSVHVGTYKMDGMYSLCIEVTLKQMVALTRNPEMKRLAETWETKGVGSGGQFRLQEVRARVVIKVGEFVTAYRAANPSARSVTIPPPLQERRLNVTRVF